MTERTDDIKLTPRPHDSITYLKSPILTLLASIEEGTVDEPAAHDLLDAYTTLLLRLRTIAPSLNLAGNTCAAIEAVSHTFDSLARCLQRDIRRALDPTLTQDTPALLLGAIGTFKSQTAEGHTNVLREVSMTCQLAIQVVTIILKFPSLHSIFSDHSLSRILDDMLVVSQSLELPAINAEKTCAMAAASFSILQIPAHIMLRKKVSVLLWMRELVDCMSPATDGSKIVHHLLSTYPDIYLQPSLEFLPEILPRLLAANSDIRTDATVALCGYARAVLLGWSSISDKLKRILLAKVREFLVPQLSITTDNRTAYTSSGLPQYLASATSEDSGTLDARGARWAVTVICCLTILCGRSIFLSHRLCRFVLSTAERLVRSKSKPLSELLVCVWRSLVWAFLQITPDDVSSRPSMGNPATDPLPQSPREIAFVIVKQELRDGVGACLVAGLLYAHIDGKHDVIQQNVGMAISVLKDMVSHPQERVYYDGMAVLVRMLSAVGIPSDPPTASTEGGWTPNDIVLKALLGRHVFTAPSAEYYAVLRSANQFDVSVIRRLAENEIEHSWMELSEVWTSCVQRELYRDNFLVLPDSLLHVWQALLLVQTQLTQEQGHLTTTHDFSETPVHIVSSFLRWVPTTPSKRPLPPAITTQQRTLSLCNQLWAVIRNVYSISWLTSAAKSLLAIMVQDTFVLSDEDVRTAWRRFCAELVSLSAFDSVIGLISEDEGRRVVVVRRTLWELMALNWVKKDPPPSVVDSVTFLAIPMRDWPMTEDETALWTAVLDHTMSLPTTTSSVGLFAALMDSGAAGIEAGSLLAASKAALLLLPRLQLQGKDEHEALSKFLWTVNTVLLHLYASARENMEPALEILKEIRHLIQICRTDMILTLFSSLSEGLAVWIGDEQEFLLVQEHNDIVVPLYCDALTTLRNIPFSSNTLQALAHFLYSAFIRIPAPGEGPVAFYKFWSYIQPSLGDMKGEYPDEIKTALRACHDVFAIELPPDMSLDMDSHTTTPVKGRSSLMVSPVIYESPLKHSSRAGGNTHRNLEHSSSSPLPPSSSPPASTMSPLSTPMPSSPTDAIHVRRMGAARSSRVAHESVLKTPDRPLKRQKLSSPSPEEGKQIKPTTSPPTTPKVLKRTRMAAVLSPEVPSPGTAARRAAASSDDYDAWEVPMCVDEETDIVPDSQPAAGSDDDDSLVPSFMKTFKRENSANDTIILADDNLDSPEAEVNAVPTSNAAEKQPQRPGTSLRTHTAPASFLNKPPVAEHHAVSLPPRARTTSAQLDELRNLYNVLEQDGSQMHVNDMLAASTLTNRLGTLISEKLSKKLSSGTVQTEHPAKK